MAMRPATRRRGGTNSGDPRPGRLALEDIHKSVQTAVDLDEHLQSVPVRESDSTKVDTGPSPFHETLHEYLLFARPKNGEDVRNLAGLVVRLARLCGTSPDTWKVFLLVAFHRRYHARAPAAKSQREGDGDGEKKTDGREGADASGDDEDAVAGDGERLLFYGTCLTLNRLAKLMREPRAAGFPKESASATATSKGTKVHTSALCWIPPEGDVHDAIQSIRRKYDKQIKRWPPHVNLLYPFVPGQEFESAAAKLAESLRGIEPFDVTLQDIDHFTHGPRARTAWLKPEETREFVELQRLCQTAFPNCDDQTARTGEFAPHLSVGQCATDRAVDELRASAGWRSRSASCGEICLISRNGADEPFEVRWRVELGTGKCTAAPAAASLLHRPPARTSTAQPWDGDGRKKFTSLLEAAALAMVKAAPEVGGTRDVNAMIEHLTFQMLLARGQARLELVDKANAPKSFKRVLLPALGTALRLGGEGGVDPTLDSALETAAALLDGDIAKCTGSAEEKEEEDIMSTIHVTLPHRDRGNAQGSSFQRKLANCVAEVLVWQRTKACQNEERFSSALTEFRKRNPASDPITEESTDSGHKQLLHMQTTARKKRKILNDRARSQGSMLCSLYLQDKALVSFWQIRRGKVGDLSMLKKLASKSGDKRVLKMLTSRNMDPSKATPIESVGALVNQWRDIHSMPDEGSIEALELELQAQTVRVTLQTLRSKVRGAGGDDVETRRALVTALGRSKANAACAILVAAALQPQSCLRIQSEERDVSNEESIMEALNDVLAGEPNASEDESAQAVLKEEMGDFNDAVFLSSSDIEVDETTLKRLQAEGKTVRVHSTTRVESVEPLNIELNDEISDRLRSGCQVSVAVLLDCTGSMGCEIEGCKKGALKAIEAFNDLAPVKCASFLGYWDPVNSHGDPDPRSTGFLDPRLKENLEEIQEFVNTKLPCTGGGDEPEDIPAALEKLLGDMKSAGLSAEDGVHFVFFIADAGYRDNEDERVSSLLRQLEQLGVVMVMCPVRSYGTCRTLVAKNKEVFRPGKYIEVQGVSALGTIASAVTESIRASLFKQGNVASVTASVGETMDSLCQLCAFQKDHIKMKHVAELSSMPSATVDGTEGGAVDGEEEGDADAEDMPESGDPEAAEDTDGDVASKSKESAPIFMPSNTFSLTNVDRIYIQISRLPDICHRVVEGAFGGKSLQEVVAGDIASRLVKQAIPVSELLEAGYPSSIVELVRNIMGGHGLRRQQQAEQAS